MTFIFVGTLIVSLLDGLKVNKIKNTAAHLQHWERLIYTVNASTAALDVVIAGMMSYYLLQRRQGVMAACVNSQVFSYISK